MLKKVYLFFKCAKIKIKKMYNKKNVRCALCFFHKQGCLEARGRSHRGYYARVKRYLYDFWNVVDLLSYVVFITAISLLIYDQTNKISKRMIALSVLVMYLRFLEVFLIHRTMGPTLIMITKMVCVYILPLNKLNYLMTYKSFR